MGKAPRKKQGRAPIARRQNGRARGQWKAIAGWCAALAAVVVLGLVFYQNANRTTTEDPTITALAEANAGGPVTVYTGPRHTVYHSQAPLPSPGSPQSSGLPTLVWFSGTWCEFCEHMEPFAHEVASRFAGELVFVEKSVDHDRSAANRYGVLGTPTFVLVDHVGEELDRFGFERTESGFSSRISTSISR